MGYEKIRETILANQIKMGIVPPNTELSPINPYADRKSADGKPWSPLDVVRPWDSLSDGEKKLFARMAEVYAGFCSYTDHEIGRLIDYLEKSGQLDNTLIVVISDNGASGEGGPNGSVNENNFFNGVPDSMEDNLKHLEDLGSENTYNHYPTGWAMAFNTPFKLWKRYSWNGGICDPMMVHWPKGIKAKGEVRDQYTHCSDVVPTIYDCLGIELPAEVKGYTQWPLEGQSFKYSFEDAKAPTQKDTQYYVMLGTRGIWQQGWKADTIHPSAPGNWSHFTEDVWELYNTETDRSECHNLADKEPVKLRELQDKWFVEAGKYFGIPLEDRDAVSVLTTPRPQMSPPRSRYIYYPNTLEVPEAVAVNVRGRSFKIAAEVTIETPGGRGRPVCARPQVRRPCALHQGRQAQVCLQLPGRERADDHLQRGRAEGQVRAGRRIRQGEVPVRFAMRQYPTSASARPRSTSTTRRSASTRAWRRSSASSRCAAKG